jgi:uncharacterized membrane protein
MCAPGDKNRLDMTAHSTSPDTVPEVAQPLPASPWERLPKALFAGGLLGVVGLFVTATPPSWLAKAKIIGFALCHQMPDRSFFVHDHQYPLCARCTGMYLGFITGLIFLLARKRLKAARLPPAPLVATLIGFIVLMGIDGLNSTISIIPGAPQLYHTTNVIRLITGTLYGLALSMLFPPFFNSAIWKEPSGERTIKNWRELAWLVLAAGIVIAIVLIATDYLLLPVSIITIGGVLLLLSILNSVIILSMRKLENALSSWRQLAFPMLFGLAVGLIEITFLVGLRVAVGNG